MTPVRILLVESNQEDALFLQDALAEIEESRARSIWMSVYVQRLEQAGDAVDVLASDPFDVVLLNLDLPDSTGVATFARVRAAAPQVPIVLLIEPHDEVLARHLLREGAQDYLVKREVDCIPLARTIQSAMARQRVLTAAQSAPLNDALTGALTPHGFYAVAFREYRLARRAGRSAALILVILENLTDIEDSHGPAKRDLILVEAADLLRAVAAEDAIVARTGLDRFLLFATDIPAETILIRALNRLDLHPPSYSIAFGSAESHTSDQPTILDLIAAAETSLCENKLAYQT